MPENTLDGASMHEWANVQIDIYHHNYDDLLDLIAQVVERLDEIQPSEYGGAIHIYDTDAKVWRGIVEYGFWQTTM